MSKSLCALVMTGVVLSAGCATMGKQPTATVKQVDVARYMGPWYVIASIPTYPEKKAFNAIESYEQNPDGTIKTTFTFHKGAFDGPLKTMHPTGFIQDPSNAVWGMRVFWPVKAEYRISYLDRDYSEVLITRTARDYLWIMARKPQLGEADYRKLVDMAGKMGYDTAKIEKVPQRWP